MKAPFSWNAGVARIRAVAEIAHITGHLLQDLVLDAELLQQLFVHLRAVGGTVSLQLSLIAPTEFSDGDLAALDAGDGVTRGGVGTRSLKEIWNVEEHERHADKAKAPLEPVPVPAHPIKHGHE